MDLEEYIQKPKAHVEAQSLKFVCDDSESILEMLYFSTNKSTWQREDFPLLNGYFTAKPPLDSRCGLK